MKAYGRKATILAAVLALFLTAAAGCGGKINEPGGSTSPVSQGASDAESGAPVESDSSDATDPTGQDASTPSDTASGNGDSTNPGGNASKPGGNNQGHTATTTKGGGGSSFKEPVYDLKGRVIVIGSESVPDMSKTNIYNESIKLTQEKYHCTFKFIKKEYVSLYQDLINGHAAGKSNYDVVNLRGYEIFPNAANSGTILDVSSYYDFAGDPTWQESSVKDLGVFKGKRYGIPYSPNEVGNGIWYNRALLRKFNVPDLWTYVEKDTWNWQTFRAVCKKLTQDTNGDG